MRLTVKTNVGQVMEDLQTAFDQVTSVAIPRTLNELRDQAQTAGLRKLADIYRIGPRTMDQYVSLSLATARTPEAAITVKGHGFPLSELQPRQIRGVGISFVVKGQRITVPHAFVAKMASGHVGVFARGGYGGKSRRFNASGSGFGRFLFSTTRLSINELYSYGPAEAFGNAEVTAAMQDRVEEQAANVLKRNIRFAVKGAR